MAKKTAPCPSWDFKKINSLDDFKRKFWQGSNGNDLIKELNKCGKEDRIRREKEGPVIYAIVLNNCNHGLTSPYRKKAKCKLVKVGFTQDTMTKEKNNRMEQLIKKIPERYKPKVFSVYPIGCVDTTPFHQTEERIRKKFGQPVAREKIAELNLPATAEWVLTTQKQLDEIKWRESKAKREGKSDLIDIFKGLSLQPPLRPQPNKKICIYTFWHEGEPFDSYNAKRRERFSIIVCSRNYVSFRFLFISLYKILS